MPTERITIKQAPGRDIEFDGELVARAKGKADQPATDGRWYEIAVYRRVDAMWVVCIRFHTSSPQATSYVDVEVLDGPDEVEAVLLLYEPLGHGNARPNQFRYDMDKQGFLKSLRSAYCSLADQILAEMQPLLDEYRDRPVDASVNEPQSSRCWRGFLSMLGVR